MPIDPDEESLPGDALPKPEVPAPFSTLIAAPASSNTEHQGFSWGLCGVLHEVGELKAYPGARGVTRFVADGISYTPPPLKTPTWKPTPGQADSFQIPWPDNPANARTLETFRQELEAAARTGQLRKGTDPILAQLNQFSEALCDQAVQLHRAKWSLGLLHPKNVLLRITPSGVEPLLIDLGFIWKGSFGPPPWDASPGKPSWLDACDSEWLYDVAPVRQQMADPNERSFPANEPIRDVKLLARLFAWLISGSRDQVVRVPRGATAPHLWELLAAASAGRIGTVEELRQELRANPLSEHFTDPVVLAPLPPAPLANTPKAEPASMLPVLLVGIVCLLALAGGGAYFAGLFDTPKPVATGSTTSPTGPVLESLQEPIPEPAPEPVPEFTPQEFSKILDQLKAAFQKKDFNAVAEQLIAGYKLGKLPQKAQNELDEQRDAYLNAWNQEYQQIVRRAASPTERINAITQLKALELKLRELAVAAPITNPELLEKENQCLELSAILSRQLGFAP